MLAEAIDTLPRWLASVAVTMMPSQDATSGSASNSAELVAPVPGTTRWPPSTRMAAPCEKTWTSPRLGSILSVTSGGTMIPSHDGTVGSGLFVELIGRLYGLPVPYGLLVAVQVAVWLSPASVAIGPQGTVVGRTLEARTFPVRCGWTVSTPPAVNSTAAMPTPTPYFQASRSNRLAGEAGGFRRCRTSSLTPSLGTGHSALRRSRWLQRRVLTLGDRFLTVKQIARNSEHPAHSGAAFCPKRQAAARLSRLAASDLRPAASRSWAVRASPWYSAVPHRTEMRSDCSAVSIRLASSSAWLPSRPGARMAKSSPIQRDARSSLRIEVRIARAIRLSTASPAR